MIDKMKDTYLEMARIGNELRDWEEAIRRSS